MLLEIRKKLSTIHDPLRPPGAVGEKHFEKKCIRCRKCAEVCPYDAIEMAHIDKGLQLGTPYIYAAKSPCYLCDDFPCIEACPTEALENISGKKEVKMGLAKIDTSTCFIYNGIYCISCYERCPIYREAITLKDGLYPVVHSENCVGCGICEHVCPTDPKSVLVFPVQN